ncbi:energy transducer TonB [Pseudomonas sp. DC3000-4b1]|uniref:energy transducer TonB n=1 Tax=unclassified Pseudomonas TaxID=196821 RepID=UPI003CF9780C
MLTEPRRRAYLDAMQVVQWLPRAELPFAAPSRPELLAWVEAPAVAPAVDPESAPGSPLPTAPVAPAPAPRPPAPSIRPKIEVPRPSLVKAAPTAKAVTSEPVNVTEAKPQAPAPRFALQLLRAGNCLVLVELPTGEPFQSRDPGYLLLKDMLRAAGLPDAPQLLGEPVRWPLLARGSLDQGPQAARDFVQGFVAAQLEQAPCACLWLIGLPALRYAGEQEASAYYQTLTIDTLCEGWALPGLETLMDEPARKADVWHAMRRLMARWKPLNE